MVKISMPKSEFRFDVNRAVAKAFDDNFMKVLGKEAKTLIFNRTKRGYGVSSDFEGEQRKLLPLQQSYVDQRERHKDSLGYLATAKKSNATYTGQMLNSMAVDAFLGGFEVFVKDTPRKLSKLTNKQVCEYYQIKRQFLNLTKGELRTIMRLFEERIRSLLNMSKPDII